MPTLGQFGDGQIARNVLANVREDALQAAWRQSPHHLDRSQRGSEIGVHHFFRQLVSRVCNARTRMFMPSVLAPT